MIQTADILGIPFACVDMDQAVETIEGFITAGGTHQVVTANAEMVMYAQKDAQFREILRGADLVLPDGAGVVWASKYLARPLPERVAGVDLVERLCVVAAQNGYSLYLLGAAPGVADKAAQRIRERWPGVPVAGVRHGYFSREDELAVIDEIRRAKPAILLVALGFPRQEKWIKTHRETLGVPVSIGVGGTLDVLSGAVQRAPLWMQRAGLEWFYRLVREPRRLGRMLVLPRFVLTVLGAWSPWKK